MVSVIVPVFNVEKYVDQCIRSIVEQSYRDLEILLLDDGSTDASGEICRKWKIKDKRIIYICKKNEGLGATRNLGVQMASGDILAFVDSDDWIEPEFIEEMLGAMGESDMVFCDYNLVKKDRILTGRRYCYLNSPCALSEMPQMLYAMGAATWNKLYRKELWQTAQIKQPSHAYEDTGVMPIYWAQAKKIAQLRRPLCNYRIDRPESITNNCSNAADMFRAIDEILEAFTVRGLRNQYSLHLEKYCAMALSIPLSRMKENLSGQQQAKAFYYERFPDAKRIDEMSTLIVGSMHGEYAMSKACFLRNEFKRIQWSQDWQRVLQTTDARLILIDFSGDVLPDVKILANLLNQVSGMVCILNGLWTAGSGLYGVEVPYLQVHSIEAHNRKAASHCAQLREILPHAVWLTCNDFDFTDAEFPLGVIPMYRNNYYYYSIAEQLWAVLRSIQ